MGPPVERVTPAHEAATRSGRGYSFSSNPLGPTRIITDELETVRARARHAYRNDPWARAIINSLVSNLVGVGIRPHWKNDTAAVLWAKHRRECDADGLTTFEGLQTIVCRTWLLSGECFGRLRNRRPSDGLKVPLQIQLIEPDQLPVWNTRDLPNGNRVVASVEFNPIGKRVAYHVLRSHPGEWGDTGQVSIVPAGEMVHIFKPERPGQVRGMSTLSPSLMALWDFHDYDDAERKRKHYEALISLFITKPEGAVSPFETGGTTEVGASGAELKGKDVEWGPGSLYVLPPGHDVNLKDPAVNGSYADYTRSQGHRAAIGAGVAYHQATGDLREVNYSSIRAGILELRRQWKVDQEQVIIPQFCWPYERAFISQAILSGALPISSGALDIEAEWFPPGWEWVDPQKEVAADVEAVNNKLASRREVVAKRGRVLDDVFRELAEEEALAASYGIDLSPQETSATAVPDPEAATQAQEPQPARSQRPARRSRK